MKVVLGGKRAGIDDLIFTFMLLNVFLLVFINEGQSIVELLITVFATVRVLQMSQTDKCIRKKLLIIAGVFVYLFIPTITSGEFAYFYKNIQYMYRPIIVLTYLSSLLHLNPDVFERVLKKNYWIFNIYYYINILVMLYQIDANVFYDNITGFIGIYGTHRLTAFVCFLLLLNINLIKEKGMKQTGFLIVNTVLILASTLWISSKNDNTAMYIFIPLTLILYFVNAKKVTLSTLFKVSMLVLVAIVIFSQLMKVNEIRFFFESRLISKIEGFLAFFSTGRIEEERYAYIDYALQWLNGKSIGIGIGRVKLVGDPIISSSDVSLRNWGMSNMASFIAAGGLVFTFIYILIYTYIVIAPQKNKKLFISLSIIFLALFYYGQTATSIPMVTFVWMMLYPFFIGKKDFKFSEADEGDNSI